MNMDPLAVAGLGLLLIVIIYFAVRASATKIPLDEKDCPHLHEVEHILHSMHFAVIQEVPHGQVLLDSQRLSVRYEKGTRDKILHCSAESDGWSIHLNFKHGKPWEWWSNTDAPHAFVEANLELAMDILKLAESKFANLPRIVI